MGLPAALIAHRDGDVKLAAHHYERALEQKDYKAVLFQNYGSLLREAGAIDKAYQIYKKGITLFPDHRGIRLNFANFLRNDNPFQSFELHLGLLQEKLKNSPSDISPSDVTPLIDLLEELGFVHWAYQVCRWSLLYLVPHPSLYLQLFKLLTHDVEVISESYHSTLISKLDTNVDSLSDLDQIEYHFALMNVFLKRQEFSNALEALWQARNLLSNYSVSNDDERQKLVKLNNLNSWNMGCILLTHQHFEDGWKLYEYGLRTKANGPQKWQRALPKPFSVESCAIWRGEALADKRILLLEEQAIGDVMQFMTLLPSLIDEASHVSVLINNRLVKPYRRSLQKFISSGKLSICSFEDFKNGALESKSFDYQSPLGSICQHRFVDITKYGQSSPILIPNSSLVAVLRDKYLADSGKHPVSKIVGISWRGGGRADRIKQKSVQVDEFLSLLTGFTGIRFVSLQYGESQSIINQWKKHGVDAIHDETINPLKDMDSWLSQVAACDAVISVANTTIHGAGGLNKPTLCLLSKHSDWRWFLEPSVTRSYWYPTVGIARQSADGSWRSAMDLATAWLRDFCPMPSGPQFM